MLVLGEALVSRLVEAIGKGSEWTVPGIRQPVGRFLGWLRRQHGSTDFPVEVGEFRKLLQQVSDYRNGFAHCFTSRGTQVAPALKKAQDLPDRGKEALRHEGLWKELARLYVESSWREECDRQW